MQVGNIDTSTILGSVNFVQIASYVFYGMIVIIAIGIAGWYFYAKTRNKISYSSPVTLTQYFENGNQKTTYGLVGGKFVNKSNVNDFRIKSAGWLSFKTKELGYMPDFSKADADGTVHFLTSGDGNFWQQLENKLVITKKIMGKDKEGKDKLVEEINLIMTPIRSDIKTYTMNSIKNWGEMLNKNKLTVFGIGLGMFIIMVIAHLISLYIQTKIRCPGMP